MIKNIKWILLVSCAFVACETNLEEEVVTDVPVTAGDANFSKYIAIGDSYGAGFSDGSLFVAGQLNSYPEQMARQFAAVGGGVFKSPLMADNTGGLLFGGAPFPIDPTQFAPRLVFRGFFGNDTSKPIINLVSNQGTQTTEATTVISGPFNNISVPGAKSYHIGLIGYGSAQGNPYFRRFASSQGASMLSDALLQQPTFFSLWIGGNDVLTYATSGGTGVDRTGNLDPRTYNSNDITDPAVFSNAFNGAIDLLTANGRKGVVANLPNVNTLPFFTTLPYNPIPALPKSKANSLNQLFGVINQITKALNLPNRFEVISEDDNNSNTVEKSNPLLIVDEELADLSSLIRDNLTPVLGLQTATFVGNLYGKARHAKNNVDGRDYILLSTGALIDPLNNIEPGIPSDFAVRGISYPLQDALVLTIDEASKIARATEAYNQIIENTAKSKGLAFFDARQAMNQLVKGDVRFGNYSLGASFIKGGAFSLDGVHPSPRGYSFIANKMIEAINTQYKSTLRMIDLGKKPALFPVSIPAGNYVN
ncbi:G-D-S-L family lipolytic protein [Flavobacterium oreochromis]|uniref:G-D-S-L family lipolytic protein n=1 Tax=Flavobacterium oreochromis TaxID=2906078 RepID=UPI00385AB2EF